MSSISPTKLAARFMNLDVDRGAGFTDHEGAVGNDSAEQWDTAFPTKPNKPSADPGTDPSHLQTMVRSHQNQLATLQNMMGSLVSTVDKMAARLHKTARKSGDTSSDSSSSGSEEAGYTPPQRTAVVGPFKTRSRHKFSLRPYLPRGERRPNSFAAYVSAFTALIIAVSQAGHPVAGLLDHLRFVSDKAMTRVYATEAIINYDEDVRRLAEAHGLEAFSYGHPELIHKHLGVDGTLQMLRSKSKVKSGPTQMSSSSSRDSGACWQWNYRQCVNKSCGRRHICYLCFSSAHSQRDCTNVRRMDPARHGST